MIDEVKGDNYINEPIAFELDDSNITETIEPYFMARIVDVAEFLKIYPWDDDIRPFHFIVDDPVAEWNNGIFGLQQNNNDEVEIVREAIGKPVKLTIGILSALLMSYKSPSYLHKSEYLKTDAKTLHLIEKLIPAKRPYFSDYF
jgi:predicted acetyltransferase